MSAVYGCHNREPLKATSVVPAGWTTMTYPHTEVRVVERIHDPMTKDCQYTHSELGQADAKCDGCKHRAEPAG